MISDTIKTPFPATMEGRTQCLAALGSLARQVRDEDIIELPVDVVGRNTCPAHAVLGIVVQDPDRFALADRIAAAVNGTRLGTHRFR
jgi:hypothetical protein